MKIEKEIAVMNPKVFWKMVRNGDWRLPTIEPCEEYLKAGLCVIPKEYALDFLTFCHRNPRPCPIIDITDEGSPHPSISPEADLRTDIPKYNVFVDGELKDEVTDINNLWRDDLIGFLLGCGVPLDRVLREHGVDFISPHALHISNIPCKPAGRFNGPMAVACRLFKNMQDVVRAVQIASRMPFAHGTPVHIGDPTKIGIDNIYKGAIVSVPEPIGMSTENLIPVFWGCGCTLELVNKNAGLPLMITQAPAHMFITDRKAQELIGV
ncbi:MAG: DUF1445 domain-containing protein [Deltaproteobacteria bacterium]|nr:DUF1445 domain-containing protein [Deltaproteobacteria bacterium]